MAGSMSCLSSCLYLVPPSSEKGHVGNGKHTSDMKHSQYKLETNIEMMKEAKLVWGFHSVSQSAAEPSFRDCGLYVQSWSYPEADLLYLYLIVLGQGLWERRAGMNSEIFLVL